MPTFARSTVVSILILLALGAAQAPETPPFESDVVLVYESDTRAYYRPCG